MPPADCESAGVERWRSLKSSKVGATTPAEAHLAGKIAENLPETAQSGCHHTRRTPFRPPRRPQTHRNRPKWVPPHPPKPIPTTKPAPLQQQRHGFLTETGPRRPGIIELCMQPAPLLQRRHKRHRRDPAATPHRVRIRTQHTRRRTNRRHQGISCRGRRRISLASPRTRASLRKPQAGYGRRNHPPVRCARARPRSRSFR